MMARAKNLRFYNRNKRVIFLSLSRSVFLKKWKSFSGLLTLVSLDELEKTVETPGCGSSSNSNYRSLKLSLVFL